MDGCCSSQPFLAVWQYKTSPTTPWLINSLAWWTPLKKFIIWPAMKITPFSLHASTISLQSSYDRAIGFSQKTFFPFWAALITGSLCRLLGEATITQSTSSLWTNSSSDEATRAPNSSATASAFSGSYTTVITAPSFSFIYLANSAPKYPVPTTP